MKELKHHSRRKRKLKQNKDNSERWLLTYADMITLLLGLFIIMYSISTVDTNKLKSIAGSIRGGFGLDTLGDSLVNEGNTGKVNDPDLVPKSIIYRLWERLKQSISKTLVVNKVLIKLENNEELTLTLPASSLGEGKIKLPTESDELFQRLSEVNRDVPLEIVVRVQIPYLDSTEKDNFQNNWEFNAHRASIIAKFISKKYGISESNISVQGLADFQRSNQVPETPEDEANQERLEILIKKKKEVFTPKPPIAPKEKEQ
ncbi:MAG: flagellar motor protein MotB [Leptospiraceae bacterium]|nr:flagellar motor protein MotB [Leptospiraceae bacterium]